MIYYNNYIERNTREICHEIKKRNEECYRIMADFFLAQEIIDSQSLLIPAPQHEGYAIYTKEIAEMIASESGAEVADVIKSRPRQTLYECKQKHQPINLGFELPERLNLSGKKLYFVDNVLHTGQTLYTCEKLIGCKLIPLVYGIATN